jgi:hypothetical protein
LKTGSIVNRVLLNERTKIMYTGSFAARVSKYCLKDYRLINYIKVERSV